MRISDWSSYVCSSDLILAALLAAAPACYGQSAPQPQTAPQVAPGPPITAQTAAGDPPARVGRLAQMTGTVSFHTADADQWSPASLNYPVTRSEEHTSELQ